MIVFQTENHIFYSLSITVIFLMYVYDVYVGAWHNVHMKMGG